MEAKSFRSWLGKQDTLFLAPTLNWFSRFLIMCIKANKCSVSTNISDKAISVSLYMLQLYFQKGAWILNQSQKLLALNFSPADFKINKLHHVDYLGVGWACRRNSKVTIRVYTTNAGFASEGYHVWWSPVVVLQIPVIMSPHFSTLTKSSSCLINDECNSMLFCQTTKSFIKSRSCLSVLIGCDWFNNYGCNIFLLCLSLLN